MPRQLTTLQKAKKILAYSQNLQAIKHSATQIASISQSQGQQSFSSGLKNQSKPQRDFSFSKNKSKQKSTKSLKQSILQSKQRLYQSRKFVSAYDKQTRFDKIMKLKVKPAFQYTVKKDKSKRSISSNSERSCHSNKQIKQNTSRKKISRLEKIMQIKVNKPIIGSTFFYQQITQSKRSSAKQREQRIMQKCKQHKATVEKSIIYEEKEEKFQNVVEKEKRLKYKLKKNAQQRQLKEQRRKEQRFQNMLSKLLMKLQNQRQIVKRKSECLSNCISPFH